MTAIIKKFLPAKALETRETLLGLKMLINSAQQRPLSREEVTTAFQAIDKELAKQ